TGEEAMGRVLCEFPAGDQHQVRPRGPENYSRVADGVHQKQPATGGLGSPHEPGGAGLDELLRAVLSLEVRSGAPSYQRGSRALGATEIQAVQTPGTSIDALAGKHRATGPQSVRPVAARRATGGWRGGAGGGASFTSGSVRAEGCDSLPLLDSSSASSTRATAAGFLTRSASGAMDLGGS